LLIETIRELRMQKPDYSTKSAIKVLQLGTDNVASKMKE
jgi:hypothetical protein